MTLLRSTTLLVLVLTAGGCGAALPGPPELEGDAETTHATDASTGANASATSTTGQPPATSSSTLDASTSAGSTTDTRDDTGATFVPEPPCVQRLDDDHEARCSFVECDVALQDCPEGEKCVPWANDGGNAWNANRCAPLPEDPAALGEPCLAMGSPFSGIDDCVLGALCFGVDPRTLQGTCTALCDADDPAACPDGEVCVADDAYAPQVCLPRCDPTDPAACPAEESCRPVGEDVLCVPTVALPPR